MVKAIAFDVGGVLQIDKCPKVSTSGMKRGQKCNGVHDIIVKHLHTTIDTWFDAIDTTYADSITGKVKEEKALNIISSNLKISKAKLKRILIKSYRAYFRRNNQLYNIVKKLRKNKYKTIILSDQWPPSKEALIPKKDKNLFNASIISCDVGFRKPNPEIYKLAIKKAKVLPHELVFIDNRDWNTIPAEKLGIKTILFKNNAQTIKELNKMGVDVK